MSGASAALELGGGAARSQGRQPPSHTTPYFAMLGVFFYFMLGQGYAKLCIIMLPPCCYLS